MDLFKDVTRVRLFFPDLNCGLDAVENNGCIEGINNSNNAWWVVNNVQDGDPDKGFKLSQNGHFISSATEQLEYKGVPALKWTDKDNAAIFVTANINETTGQYTLLNAGTNNALGLDTRGYLATIEPLQATNNYPNFQYFSWKDQLELRITQQQLDNFKALSPNNPSIQNLSLQNVLDNTRGKSVNWNILSGAPGPRFSTVDLNDCQKAIGFVIYDAIVLAIGAYGLRGGVNANAINNIAEAALPAMSKIESIIAKMSAANATKTDLAMGVFDILKAIYSGECLGAVIAAFTDSLDWWDAILYGITAVATIVAFFATDGLAFAAEVAIVLTSFGFFASDSVKAMQACNIM